MNGRRAAWNGSNSGKGGAMSGNELEITGTFGYNAEPVEISCDVVPFNGQVQIHDIGRSWGTGFQESLNTTHNAGARIASVIKRHTQWQQAVEM